MLHSLIVKSRRIKKEFSKEYISHYAVSDYLIMPMYHLNHLAFHRGYLSHTLGDSAIGSQGPSKNSGLDGIHNLGKSSWQQLERKGATKEGRTAPDWVLLLIHLPRYLSRDCLVLGEEFS